MLTPAELQYNRQLVLNDLEHNPAGYKQVTGKMADCKDGRCAVGLMGEALHFSPRYGPGVSSNVAFSKEVGQRLGMSESQTSHVISRNDSFKDSFAVIAQYLRKLWNM